MNYILLLVTRTLITYVLPKYVDCRSLQNIDVLLPMLLLIPKANFTPLIWQFVMFLHDEK